MFWRVRKPAYEPVLGIYAEIFYSHVCIKLLIEHSMLPFCVIEEYV